jgi:hypothetical protein
MVIGFPRPQKRYLLFEQNAIGISPLIRPVGFVQEGRNLTFAIEGFSAGISALHQ